MLPALRRETKSPSEKSTGPFRIVCLVRACFRIRRSSPNNLQSGDCTGCAFEASSLSRRQMSAVSQIMYFERVFYLRVSRATFRAAHRPTGD